jgi:hypothetical protein
VPPKKSVQINIVKNTPWRFWQLLSRNKKMTWAAQNFWIYRLQIFTWKTTTQHVIRKCFLCIRTLVPLHQQPISVGFSNRQLFTCNLGTSLNQSECVAYSEFAHFDAFKAENKQSRLTKTFYSDKWLFHTKFFDIRSSDPCPPLTKSWGKRGITLAGWPGLLDLDWDIWAMRCLGGIGISWGR